MKGKLDDLARAKHIADCIAEIELFLKMFPLNEIETNLMFRRALERSLEIIGEASVHLTEETKNNHPNIQWRGIKDSEISIFMNISGLIWNLSN